MRRKMGGYAVWGVMVFGTLYVQQASAGVLKSVSGPNDLDLSGTIYYGINLGGTSDVLVGGKWLESDNDGDPAPVGYTITLPTNIWTSGWGYGSLTDLGLQKTYDSMRYVDWPNALEMSFRYLPPGQPVRVQLLLSEGFHDSSQRRFDIEIEGQTEFTNVDPWTLWGYKNPGLAETVVTVSQDGILNVRLIGNAGAPDKNPVLDGIIVSSVRPALPSPTISSVTGPQDLDLSTPVYYAVNVGGDSDDRVAGVWFESDADGDGLPIGYTVNSTTIARNWANPSISDLALKEVYDDIRYTGGTGVIQQFVMPYGGPVKVQILLCEGYWGEPNKRPLDISIEGQKIWDDFDPVTQWGKNGAGVLTAWTYVSKDGILDIQYTGNTGYDMNAIVNGVIISAAEQRLRPVGVTASAEYPGGSYRFPAAAVLDGSWADRFATPTQPADYWLLPDGQTGYLTFDMGEPVHLTTIGLHNTNNAQYGDRGTIAYHIDISPDPNFTTYETIAAGTLQSYAEGWAFIPISTDKFWRYVRFYVDDFGGTRSFLGEMPWYGGGLAEIVFYGWVPEPSSWLLMTLGGLGLAWVGWRRRKTNTGSAP